MDGFNLPPRLSVPFSGPINPSTVNSYEIVESYPEDKYLPSYLLLAASKFHVQFAADVEGDNVRVVTTYLPNPDEWESDLKTHEKVDTHYL
jgi:hypothetical protein